MAINKVFMVGNVTADCKAHERDGETSCITFSIAVDERRFNKDTEEWDSVPNFVIWYDNYHLVRQRYKMS